MRNYNMVCDFGEVFTLADWREQVKAGCYNKYDGDAKYAQMREHFDDHYLAQDYNTDAFIDPPEDATHVVFFGQ